MNSSDLMLIYETWNVKNILVYVEISVYTILVYIDFFDTDTNYLHVYVPDNRYAEPIFIYCYKVNK